MVVTQLLQLLTIFVFLILVGSFQYKNVLHSAYPRTNSQYVVPLFRVAANPCPRIWTSGSRLCSVFYGKFAAIVWSKLCSYRGMKSQSLGCAYKSLPVIFLESLEKIKLYDFFFSGWRFFLVLQFVYFFKYYQLLTESRCDPDCIPLMDDYTGWHTIC